MIKVNFYHDTRRKNDSGLYPIRLTIANNRDKVVIATGHKVSAEDFASIKSGRLFSQSLCHIKLSLDRIKLEAEETALVLSAQGLPATPSDVKTAMLEKADPSLKEKRLKKETEVKLLATWFTRRMEMKSGKTLDSIGQTFKKISDFCPDALLDDITPSWLQRFDNFMAATAPSPNSRAVHMRNLRAVINYAIDEGATTNYPFRRFKIKKVKTAKRSLSAEELRMFFNLTVTDSDRKYLDLFKLSFLLVGINTVDLLRLTEKNLVNGRIEYYRSKTKRFYSIKVEPEAMEIINKYKGKAYLIDPLDKVGNWEHYRKRMNKALSAMGETSIGKHGKKVREPMFPAVTTYWARHSWATVARSVGVSVDDIALSLGHGDGHDLTHIYIDDDMQRIDEANRKVIDRVLYGKIPL